MYDVTWKKYNVTFFCFYLINISSERMHELGAWRIFW